MSTKWDAWALKTNTEEEEGRERNRRGKVKIQAFSDEPFMKESTYLDE